MNREDVAMDLTVQNVEILRGRLEQVEHYLAYFVDNEENHEENLAQRHMMHEEARQFLASQQVERNQCDGCQAGIPLVDGAHRMGRPGGYPDLMSCQKERYEQAEGAQGERKRFEAEVLGLGLPVERDHHGAYVSDHVRHLWSGWELRAALAQPSPAPELADELALIRAVMNGYSPSMARADGLRAVGVIDRIVGALQADRESWEQQAADRVADWDEMRQERDAAQARVAELIAALERAATAMWNSEANMDNEAADAEEAIGNAKSGAPFAQAGQVPEVSGIARAYDHPSAVILYLRKEPTDDDLRAIQEGLRVLAAAPQPAKGE